MPRRSHNQNSAKYSYQQCKNYQGSRKKKYGHILMFQKASSIVYMAFENIKQSAFLSLKKFIFIQKNHLSNSISLLQMLELLIHLSLHSSLKRALFSKTHLKSQTPICSILSKPISKSQFSSKIKSTMTNIKLSYLSFLNSQGGGDSQTYPPDVQYTLDEQGIELSLCHMHQHTSCSQSTKVCQPLISYEILA